jgi:hypothetical protein
MSLFPSGSLPSQTVDISGVPNVIDTRPNTS